MDGFDSKKILSVTDYNEYLLWKENCMNEDNCPCAAVFLLADSELLFWREDGAADAMAKADTEKKRDYVTMPWLQRLRCELVKRPTGPDGSELRIKASYIGFGTDDAVEFYEVFVEAMRGIGVYDCMQITCGDLKTEPTKPMLAHLERSDVVLIGGGDPWKLWTKMDHSGVVEQVRWRYYEGACLVGVGTGAMMIGETAFRWESPFKGTVNEHLIDEEKDGRHPHMFSALKIVPFIVAPESDETEEVIEYCKAGKVALTLSKGGGVSASFVHAANMDCTPTRWP